MRINTVKMTPANEMSDEYLQDILNFVVSWHKEGNSINIPRFCELLNEKLNRMEIE